MAVVWFSGSMLVSINEATLIQAQLVLGWVTIFGWQTISVCNQPPGQFSLAIHLWVDVMHTSESWDMNGHTTWRTSSMSVVLQHKLASSWDQCSPICPCGLAKTFCAFRCNNICCKLSLFCFTKDDSNKYYERASFCYRQLMNGFVSTKYRLGSQRISLRSMAKQKIR